MEDKYEGLSDEELKEIFEDMEADYWISVYLYRLVNNQKLNLWN